MSNAVHFITPPNPTVTPAAGPAPVEALRKEEPRKEEPKAGSGLSADLRLVIEEDESGSGFIYKTLDRRTGEVIQVYPREAITQMGQSADYQPGTVVDQRT